MNKTSFTGSSVGSAAPHGILISKSMEIVLLVEGYYCGLVVAFGQQWSHIVVVQCVYVSLGTLKTAQNFKIKIFPGNWSNLSPETTESTPFIRIFSQIYLSQHPSSCVYLSLLTLTSLQFHHILCLKRVNIYNVRVFLGEHSHKCGFRG